MLLASRWYINVMSGTNLARPKARKRMIKQGNKTELRNVTKESAQRNSDPQQDRDFRPQQKALPREKSKK